MKFYKLVLALFLAAFLAGCGPAQVETLVEIKSNETAFMIRLEGDTKVDQAKFMSESFLSENKVASKRVVIPQRTKSTGRMWYDYVWIPTVLVLKVDRAPIAREWTSVGKGVAVINQAIEVESSDSIAFAIGATLTAEISEANAAKFLYNFPDGKSLAKVADENIRPVVQSILSREFGSRKLNDSRKEKKEIFEIAFKEVSTFFANKGITITNLGFSDGMTYDDKSIQLAINANFEKEMGVETARQEGMAQAERNKTKIGEAIADRQAAEEFAKAREATAAKYTLETERLKIEKWDGKFPETLMQGGNAPNMLIQLPGK